MGVLWSDVMDSDPITSAYFETVSVSIQLVLYTFCIEEPESKQQKLKKQQHLAEVESWHIHKNKGKKFSE